MKANTLVRHKLRTNRMIGVIMEIKTMHKSYSKVMSVLGAEVFWQNGRIELLSFSVLEKVK